MSPENDPLWRMPLWRPYDALLDSKVADAQQRCELAALLARLRPPLFCGAS